MRVLKYLRGHIPAVALIVLLLVAQSFCELSLPAYTSSIVDTGIQSGGIEYAAPLALTNKTMDLRAGEGVRIDFFRARRGQRRLHGCRRRLDDQRHGEAAGAGGHLHPAAGHVCPPVGAGGEHRARPAPADAGRPHHA